MDKTRKAGQATIDVRWAYADMNEVAVFFTIRNRKPFPKWIQEAALPPSEAERIACPAQMTIPKTAGTILSDPGGNGLGPDQQTQVCLLVDQASLTHQSGSLAVDFHGDLGFSNPPDPSDNFHFALNIPMTPGLVTTPHQQSHIDGEVVALDRFVVTPTRVALAFSGPGKNGVTAVHQWRNLEDQAHPRYSGSGSRRKPLRY